MFNFEFHVPTKLIFGKETIHLIGTELQKDGIKKVLLSVGSGSIKNNGVYDEVVKSLEQNGIAWIECWGVQPNPVLSKVNEMIDIARKENVGAVLACGGGSVIDSAKAVCAGVYMDDIWQAFETKESIQKALPLYTVLTLSAAGTEMNPNAVVTNEEQKKKYHISGPALYPKVSIIDPCVQMSLPWQQTVNGALDAMSHVMELYFIGGESETSLALDESLIRSIIKMTDSLKNNPGDYNSRANLAWAATLALNGTTEAGQNGGDWASHGIEHGVSAHYPEVAHGAGLGVVFPAWIEYCKNANPQIFNRWAKNVWNKETVEQGITAMKEKLKSWGTAVSLKELCVETSKFEAIADHTICYGSTGAVKKLTKEDILEILKIAY
ncbi:iron-containing alcohol dehydrogenase [bacterium]